jgi:hypothetical protein
MGIHWRTRILGPNVSALAKAAWDQAGWNPDFGKPSGGKARYLPTDDFYADWARAEFGPEAAAPIASLFARIDCHLPRAADWVDGPGGIRPDPRPCDDVSKAYAFVDELAAMRPNVHGPGNLERSDYWLDNFRYLRAMAKANCTWARFNAAMQKVRAEKGTETRQKLARELALPLRRELVSQVAEMHGYLLATVSTYGELGNVTNWQQHNFPGLLVKPGEELAKILGGPLPEDCMPSKEYKGEPRLAVPVVRTAIAAGEALKLTVIVVGPSPPEAALYWRPLGKGDFTKLPLVRVARNVYAISLPPDAVQDDLEYYVEAGLSGNKTLRWPATAPGLAQTVVVAKP